MSDLFHQIHFLSYSVRSVLVKNLEHPFGLAIFGDHIYWTDQIDEHVQRANKTSGGNVTTLVDNLQGHVLDITVFIRNRTRPGEEKDTGLAQNKL